MSINLHDVKSIYPRLAAVNMRQLDDLDGIIAPRIINHGAARNDPPGAERLKRNFRTLFAAFPDFHIAIKDQVAERNKVVVR
jgi:predicted ester cyclase